MNDGAILRPGPIHRKVEPGLLGRSRPGDVNAGIIESTERIGLEAPERHGGWRHQIASIVEMDAEISRRARAIAAGEQDLAIRHHRFPTLALVHRRSPIRIAFRKKSGAPKLP